MKVNRRIVTVGVIAVFLAAALLLSLRRPTVHFDRSPTQAMAPWDYPVIPDELKCLRPVELPMGMPKLGISPLKEGKQYHFSWPEEDPSPEIEIPNPVPRKAPLNGDFLELVAFATSYPREDAPMSFLYRHPETLAPLTEAEIVTLGLNSWQSDPPTHGRFYPRLRTVFRTNQRHLQLQYWLEDSRTSSFAGQDSRFWDGNGLLVFRDTALRLWHDTPLVLHAEFNTGAPQWAELPRRLGAETVIGNRLRIQWLAESEVEFTPTEGSLPSFGKFNVYDSPRRRTSPGNQTLLRISDESLANQFGAVSPEGSIVWGGLGAVPWGGELFAEVRTIPKGDALLKLVLIPDRAELDFTIAGLPDLPNPRSIRNLFEVRIPYLKLVDESAYGISTSGAFIDAVSSASRTRIRCEHSWAPFEREMSYTFRDVTPNELLTWYMGNYPRSRIKYLPKETEVVILEKPVSWMGRLESWWERRQ